MLLRSKKRIMVGEPKVSFKPNDIDALLLQSSKRTDGCGFCLNTKALEKSYPNIRSCNSIKSLKTYK
jgi:hypothetical protein